MKFASIVVDGAPTVGVVNEHDEFVCVESVDSTLPRDLKSLLERPEPTLKRVGEEAYSRPGDLAIDEATFDALIPEPKAVWCATLNYASHVEEGNWDRPDYPGWFLRVATSLVGHGEPMLRPPVSDAFDYEGELAVIIGKPVHHVNEADALSYVAGFSCFNDGSVRDWQRHSTQITVGKNFTATGAFGPYLVTPDEVPDIARSRLTTRLNGDVMQNAMISEMTVPVPRLIAYLSIVAELQPGDVIVTGTPGGVGARQNPPVFMAPGDVVEVEVDGVGLLRNPIAAGTEHG